MPSIERRSASIELTAKRCIKRSHLENEVRGDRESGGKEYFLERFSFLAYFLSRKDRMWDIFKRNESEETGKDVGKFESCMEG